MEKLQEQRKTPPREPSEAGRVGRGGARECAQFSPQAETEQSGLCDAEAQANQVPQGVLQLLG